MSVLLGDPASISALAATLRRTAVTLAADGERLHARLDDAATGWSGPRAVRTRARIDAVADAAGDTATTLDEAGRCLQAASAELAATIAELRRLEDEAAGSGLELRDGTVHPGWGISGVADPGSVRDGRRRREDLQAQVHAAASRLGRQRSRLTRDCERASTLLRRATASLRG